MKMTRILPLLLVLLPQLATADSTSAKAEALFKQGRSLEASGQLAEACDAFDESQKLAPATTTLFNQADCREKNGQLASAYKLFNDAERATRGAADDVGKKLHKVATDRAAGLEPRLSRVTVKIGAHPDGLAIHRDETVIDPSQWNLPLPVDAGTYTFTARLGDRDVWSETITVAIAGDNQVVEVTVQKDAKAVPGAVPTPAAAAAAAATTTTTTSAEPAPGRRKMGAKIATLSAGVVLATALAFDLWGDSTYDDATKQHSMDLYNSANTKRYVAEGLGIAGVATVGVAVYLWLQDDREAPKHVVAPAVGPGTAGIQIGGRW